jgi:hypothetical protein
MAHVTTAQQTDDVLVTGSGAFFDGTDEVGRLEQVSWGGLRGSNPLKRISISDRAERADALRLVARHPGAQQTRNRDHRDDADDRHDDHALKLKVGRAGQLSGPPGRETRLAVLSATLAATLASALTATALPTLTTLVALILLVRSSFFPLFLTGPRLLPTLRILVAVVLVLLSHAFLLGHLRPRIGKQSVCRRTSP